MAINSLFRYIWSPYRLKKSRFLSNLRRHGSGPAVENYWNLLRSKGPDSNLELTLTKTRGDLDSSIVEEVLQRCSKTRSLVGLRFFIWAGLQPDYRHSAWIYGRACRLLDINQKRQTLTDVLEAYRKEGSLVSIKTFKVILNLCREAKLPEEALEMLRKMGEFNCRPDTTNFNLVIRLFSEKGDMDVALELMNEMALIDLYPDMVTYVTMIKGFCNVGRLEDGYGLFRVMRGHGCFPNVVTYSTLLDGVCKSGNLDRAMELLGEMEKEGHGCLPNVVTYTSVIQRLCENGRTAEALAVLNQMEAQGCLPNRVTVSTLIKGLCCVGRMEEAYKLIDKVVGLGTVSRDGCYSSLIVSLLQNTKLEEAEKLFRKMLVSGMKPDGLSCSLFIKQLCSDGRFLDAFVEIEKEETSISIDSDIYCVLLSGLCQQSHLTEAAVLANVMINRGIRLKAPYVDGILEYLKKSGEGELVLHLTRIASS